MGDSQPPYWPEVSTEDYNVPQEEEDVAFSPPNTPTPPSAPTNHDDYERRRREAIEAAAAPSEAESYATTEPMEGGPEPGGPKVLSTHDSNPAEPNTVDYEPIYDETGKITGYNMYVDGVLSQTFDYSDLYDRLEQIETPQTFQDYLTGVGGQYQDVTGSQEYQALQELIAMMNDPNRTAEDMALAAQQTATRLGYGSVDEMMQAITAAREKKDLGIEGQQGLTDAERAAFERQTQATIRNQQVNARRMLDQVLSGATNNSTRNALLMANEYINQIRDTEIQSNMQLYVMNAERQLQQFSANFSLYQDLIDRGEVTQEQVLNSLYQNRMGVMQGYATQVNTILQQNGQYLDMYRADLDRVRLASEQVYNGIQSELNINADMRDAISESFSQYWAEIMAPLNYETAQLEQEELRSQQTARGWRIGLGILGLVAGVLLAPFTAGASLTLAGAGLGMIGS